MVNKSIFSLSGSNQSVSQSEHEWGYTPKRQARASVFLLRRQIQFPDFLASVLTFPHFISTADSRWSKIPDFFTKFIPDQIRGDRFSDLQDVLFSYSEFVHFGNKSLKIRQPCASGGAS